MDNTVRHLRNRDVAVPAQSKDGAARLEEVASNGGRSGDNRASHRGSVGPRSHASSRRLEERLEVLALQERLALEEEKAAAERIEEERRLEEERQRLEADRQRRISEIRQELIRKEFEAKRSSLPGSRCPSLHSNSVKSISPTRRTSQWIEMQRQITPPLAEAAVAPSRHLPANDVRHTVPASGNSPQGGGNMSGNVGQHRDQNWDIYFRRKTSGKDLPHFSGDSVDWLNFITNFRRSTELCNFSDEENLARLQKALSGRARDSVSALLCVPGTVGDIIRTLELRYGRPQVIIKDMIAKINRLPPTSDDRLNSIIDLYEKTNNLVITIINLGYEEYLINPQLLDNLISKLTPNLKLMWGDELVRSGNPKSNLKHFKDWLYQRALAVSLAVTDELSMKKQKVNTLIFNSDSSKFACVFCSESKHKLETCDKFRSESVNKRREWAKSNNICYCCLGNNHKIGVCKLNKRCGVDGCRAKHHSLLHITPKDGTKVKVSDNHESKDKCEVVSNTVSNNRVLLKIIPVCVRGPKGCLRISALLDDGATATLIDKSVADAIGAKGPVSPLCVQWINDQTSRDEESEIVSLTISGVGRRCKNFSVQGVRTIEGLLLANQRLDQHELIKEWPAIEGIDITLPKEPPRMLIGQDNWALMEGFNRIRNSRNGIAMERTKLGWVLHGNIKRADTEIVRNLVHVCKIQQTVDESLHELVKSYFSLENISSCGPYECFSADEKEAIRIVDKTARCVGNRWEIGLPWKNDLPLEDSKSAALKRLYCLERKLDRDNSFAEQYNQKMQHYINMGYARKLSHIDASLTAPKTWYLPHLAVINPNKPGKIRVVFDASAKVNNASLNNALLKGPDLYNNILKILLRFRKGIVAFSGDIKEMFLQIKIREQDQTAQRFLWRGLERSREPDTYVMQVMLFGAVSSPFQAQEIRNRNAMRFVDTFPKAVEAIKTCHYMDDYLDSTDSVEEAVHMIDTVSSVHKEGGFIMCNWVSNSWEVLEKIDRSLASPKQELSLDEKYMEKVLGMRWKTRTDTFIFQVNYSKIPKEVLEGVRRPTKREVLRVVMSFYDPLGFLSFYTIRAKLILQEIWRNKTEWDEAIKESLDPMWTRWLSDLKEIEGLSIPRCYYLNKAKVIHRDIHVFCDASDRAFSAVVYLRHEFLEGNAEVAFITGKSKVAPLKQLSVPRLELQAALWGCKLAATVKEALGISTRKTVFWSDSRTVIYWISNSERRYRMYIAHRLREILEISDPKEWRWIPGRNNVADKGTKEIRGVDSEWLAGPSFLCEREAEWSNKIACDDCPPGPEVELIGLLAQPSIDNDLVLPDPDRFSSWRKLVRATAWVLRFISNLSQKGSKHLARYLTPQEILAAERLWWRKEQACTFSEEITCLRNNIQLPKRSRLGRLTPFLDETGILRIRGRLEGHTEICQEVNQPVILHSKSRFVRLLVDYYHIKVSHQGQERVFNELRQRYWIIGARNAIRSSWSRCLWCSQLRALPMEQKMARIPESRALKGCRPFTSTGVDYFGPLLVKNRKKKEKRYGVLFTCLTTRAVHIEIAMDLTTDCAVLAIRRFVSRRGCPKEIWSDNAKNFKGADLEIKNFLKNLDHSKLTEDLARMEIKWNFIPPLAPHMGGVWERLVKSVKRALAATLKDKAPKEDLLSTVLIEIEHLLNSRPLTCVSEDPTDPEALTPNHFLIGSSSGSRLWLSSDEQDLRKRWKESQHLTKVFWQRWTKEYLPSLVKSTRWFSGKPSAYDGQLVFIPEKNEAGRWTRGVIVGTYPGKDGCVRVVDVKTEKGIYRRSITSLLPVVTNTSVSGMEDVRVPNEYNSND